MGRPKKTPGEPPVETADLVRRRLLWPLVEAAELLGFHRNTLYRLAAAGEIRITKVGRRSYVSDAELHRFVANREAENA